jgi:hypothetical protein
MMPGPQVAEDAANLEKHVKKPSRGRQHEEIGRIRASRVAASSIAAAVVMGLGPPEPDLGMDQEVGLGPLHWRGRR